MMIQTTNLTRKYGDLIALDNLNLEIEEGESGACGFSHGFRCLEAKATFSLMAMKQADVGRGNNGGVGFLKSLGRLMDNVGYPGW